MDNDTISRQAAIDALVKRTHLTWESLKIINPMLDVLEELPSAQTELPLEIQDILDYLDTVLHPIVSPEYWNVYSELYDMISMLPSTERRGRWKQVGDNTYRCSVCGEISCCNSPFCSECGAKMEGEEE